MKTTSIIAVLVFTVTFAGSAYAGGRASGPSEPPKNLSCAECGMESSGAKLKFASQIDYRDGKVEWFCDAGDLLVHYEVNRAKDKIASIYVRDFETGNWTDAKTAWYFVGSKVATPMRYGILTYATKKNADKARDAEKTGYVLPFSEVISAKPYRR